MRPSSSPPAVLVEGLALDAAEHVVGRHAVVVEGQLAGVDRAVAHPLELADDVKDGLGDRVGLYQQQGAVAA